MKKNSVRVFIALLACMCFFMLSGFTDGQKVYDGADLLTDREISKLEDECLRIAEDEEIDVIILTTDDTQGKTAQDYAEDFYTLNGFGYDEPGGTGIIYLIDMEGRNYRIATSGGAITYFTDKRIDEMVDDIGDELKSGDYAQSCFVFLDYVEKYMNNLPDEKNLYNYKDNIPDDLAYRGDDGVFRVTAESAGVALVLAPVIAGIVVACMVYTAGGKVTVNASTYLKEDAVRFNARWDHFTHKTTTSRIIHDDDDGFRGGGGGGCASSTHSGSSGGTFGGGGGKF